MKLLKDGLELRVVEKGLDNSFKDDHPESLVEYGSLQAMEAMLKIALLCF